ncbi:hypothetical protein AL060_12340 [Pseudomonas syringae pv. rhaphiolepidis]|nr:hypothetical protein AL060_12340 [Pseudomonas syringae pv. rhaphiolepidis]
MFSCSESEQKQLNTWVSFQSAEQPLMGQFSVSGNKLVTLRQIQASLDAEMVTFSVDSNYTIIQCNARFSALLDRPQQQITGQSLDSLVPEYVKTLPCYRNLRAAVNNGTSVSDKYRFLKADGSLAWIQAHWQPLKDINGKITSILCLGTDVTPATEKARENEDVIAALRRSTAVIEFDLGGHVLDANQQFINTMGYSLTQLQGKHHSLFCTLGDTSSPDYAAFWRSLNRGEVMAGRLLRSRCMA